MKQERRGELYTYGAEMTWAAYPVVAVLLAVHLPPLTALAATYAIALVFFTAIAYLRGTLKDLGHPAALKDSFTVAVILAAIFALIFIGLRYTSPGNAALLGLVEFFFVLVFFNVIRREGISTREVAGSLLIILGAAIVFLPGVLENAKLNVGDLLIAGALAFTPIMHFFQRRARGTTPGEVVLLVRVGIGLPLLALAALFIGESASLEQFQAALPLLLINGTLMFGISKLWWLEAIHLLPITKAVALASGAPLITMLVAYLVLGTPPTVFQLSAFVPLALGVYLLTRKAAAAS